jgi:signal transduction histidine kinase/CheY-like chemotaxis protein
MGNNDWQELNELRKISQAQDECVEHTVDQQKHSFSLFDSALDLEEQVKRRTVELSSMLAELERSNKQLKMAKETAERANSAKTRFLAAASHDVLQPLNAALLLMSTLNSTQNNDEGRKLCRQVERSLETMDTLLRNLLYMSRLDAGDVKPHFQGVSLDRLFDSIASDFQPIAQLRNLELRVRRSGLHVWSDATMLRRSIQNIVANALRYTKEGGVLLIAGKRGKMVYVRIADTCVGIDRKLYKDIFVEFHRCPQSQNIADSSSAGMGLGLAIVERMIHTLEHKLTLNSKVGSGSCFSLILPYSEPPQQLPGRRKNTLQHPEKGTVTKLEDARVLIVDSDLVALQSTESLLRQWGCELRLACSTREAMSALKNESAWMPEIIIADQYLNSDERGTSVIRVLRQLIGQQVPAIIVATDPSERLCNIADQRQLEVMQKPVKPAQLRALLMHLRIRSSKLLT